MTVDSDQSQPPTRSLDVAANRRAQKWTPREKIGRILWDMAYPLFAFSPRPLWAWRRALLRLFGARIGKDVHIYPSVRIAIPWNLEIGDEAGVGDSAFLYSLGRIHIGAQATVSQRAHLCAGTHDYSDPALPLLKIPIVIGARTWICAEAFVGPGVSVGELAIVGARAVATKDVGAQEIVAGNPARFVKFRALKP